MGVGEGKGGWEREDERVRNWDEGGKYRGGRGRRIGGAGKRVGVQFLSRPRA